MSFSLFKKEDSKKKKPKKDGEVMVSSSTNTETRSAQATSASWSLIRHPWFTEKALRQTAQNKYVFKVRADANKAEMKKLVERGYGVKVVSVHMVNVPSKPRRRGVHRAEKPGYKKAIVTLTPESKLEIAAQ